MGCFNSQELKQDKKAELVLNSEIVKEPPREVIKESKDEPNQPEAKVEKSLEFGGCEKLAADLKIDSGNYAKVCEIPVEAFSIEDNTKKPLSFNSIIISKEGYISDNEGNEKNGFTIKGRFDIKGNVLIKQTMGEQVIFYRGKISNNVIHGTGYRTTSSFDFTIEIKASVLKCQEMILVLTIGETEISGIGTTNYGWATIHGTKAQEAFTIPLMFADGQEGKVEFTGPENAGYDLVFGTLTDPKDKDFALVAMP